MNSAGNGETPSRTIANIIAGIDELLEEHSPQAVLILGDTNSCLSAIPAKKRKIPVFHMEAGNRCFDQRVPEEINRKIVDHIADINLTYSQISRDYLIAEGLSADRVIKVGSPMKEVLDQSAENIANSTALEALDVTKDNFFLVSAHREENVDSHYKFQALVECLDNIAVKYGLDVIVSTHPRTRKRLDVAKVAINEKVRFIKPVSFTDYVKLQMNAKVVLSDSGTISEESSILGFPALNIREVHERPEGFEEAAVMLVGVGWESVDRGISLLLDETREEQSKFKIVSDYDVTNVSDKICRIIVSYTDFVKREVWKENLN